MTTGTTLHLVKNALVSRLGVRPALSGVKITYGYEKSESPSENIWLGKAVSDTVIPVMRAGTKKVDENYILDLTVQVIKGEGEGQAAADQRCIDLMREVQKELAESPQLGLENDIHWAELDGWEHEPGPLSSGPGHGSRFTVKIRVRARLF